MGNRAMGRREAMKTCAAGAAAHIVLTGGTAALGAEGASALLGGVTWIKQSGFRILNGEQVVYVDPYQVPGSPGDADLVLITHPHRDHCDAESVRKVSKDSTLVLAEGDSAALLDGIPNVEIIALGEDRTVESLRIDTVRAYNLEKSYHPRDNDWLGFVLTLADGRAMYHAGDTDFIPEMNGIEADAVFLPVGGTYTMGAEEAARAARAMAPSAAVPMHWGAAVGNLADAETFRDELAGAVETVVMENGQSIPLSETRIREWMRSKRPAGRK